MTLVVTLLIDEDSDGNIFQRGPVGTFLSIFDQKGLKFSLW